MQMCSQRASGHERSECMPWGSLAANGSVWQVQADWEAEFAKYKASPEYQKVNRWVMTHPLQVCSMKTCCILCNYHNCLASLCNLLDIASQWPRSLLRHGMGCRGMSLDDFKFIYWMEYTHRMWGRVLGLVFAVPAAYFVYRGWVNGALGRRLGLLFAMGATQGFVGWWMVRSGLQVILLMRSSADVAHPAKLHELAAW